MSDSIKQAIVDRLSKVKGPDLTGNIVDLGLIDGMSVSAAGKAMITVRVPADRAEELEPLRLAVQKVALTTQGVTGATVVLTAEAAPSDLPNTPLPAAAAKGVAAAGPPPTLTGDKPPQTPSLTPPVDRSKVPDKAPVAGIGAIVAVSSGKGGVGKSTTSVNLALALQGQGLRVGLLDADIYGPSVPRLLGIAGRPDATDGKLIPPEAFGLKAMSMGFLIEEDAPMIWRGPMVIQALTQMLREVVWGDIDVLIVDMPPGTGDVQLTMAQQVPLAGAVIVSTPQDIALIDARKGLNMFRKVEVPILGLIENMSYFICPDCGSQHDIFGHGGARSEADRLGLPFLGAVPLHMDIRETSDGGRPVVVSAPDSPHAAIYADLARAMVTRLSREGVSLGG